MAILVAPVSAAPRWPSALRPLTVTRDEHHALVVPGHAAMAITQRERKDIS